MKPAIIPKRSVLNPTRAGASTVTARPGARGKPGASFKADTLGHTAGLPTIPLEDKSVALGMIAGKAVPIRTHPDGTFRRHDTGAALVRVSDLLNTFLPDTPKTSGADLDPEQSQTDPAISTQLRTLSTSPPAAARAVLVATGTQAVVTGLSVGAQPVVEATIHKAMADLDLEPASFDVQDVATLVSNMLSAIFTAQAYEIVSGAVGSAVEAPRSPSAFGTSANLPPFQNGQDIRCGDQTVDGAFINTLAAGAALRTAMRPVDAHCPFAAAGWRAGQSLLKGDTQGSVLSAVRTFIRDTPDAQPNNTTCIDLAEQIFDTMSPFLSNDGKRADVGENLCKALSFDVGVAGSAFAAPAIAHAINACCTVPLHDEGHLPAAQTTISMASLFKDWV